MLNRRSEEPMDRAIGGSIGLTGGIGMGKSTVSEYLAQRYQLPILDADVYARMAVEPGMPILEQIRDRYGSGILEQTGALNRSRLAELVFQNPSERVWLEQQIHPFVRQQMETERDRVLKDWSLKDWSLKDQVSKNRPIVPIIVQVIPLLFEAQLTDTVDQIWVVVCPLEQQLQRLIQRRRLTLEQAEARIQSQLPIQQKCDRADVVLDNSTTVAALLAQVDSAIGHVLAAG